MLWVVGAIPFAPVIADGVGKDVTILAEACGCDGAADFRIPFEPMFGVLVPEMECAIRARSAECTMYRVERDGIDGIHLGHVTVDGVLLAMAFEGEVETVIYISAGRLRWRGMRLLPCILVVCILNCTTPLDGADCKPCCIRETTHDPRLPFERTLDRLVDFEGIVQVDDVDVAIGGRDYE